MSKKGVSAGYMHGELEFVARQSFLFGKRILVCNGKEFLPVQVSRPGRDDANLPLGGDNGLVDAIGLFTLLKAAGRRPKYSRLNRISESRGVVGALIGGSPGGLVIMFSGITPPPPIRRRRHS
jgi:hypothetical protein